jgi:serine/threonine protein kinase
MSAFRIGRFQVIDTLGSGAHSSIVQVRRSADGKNYALKVVPIGGPKDEKYLRQARHEFRVGQTLDHPCLLKVYALEEVKDWLFRIRKVHLLTEFINGKTLDTCPPLPMPKLVQVFEQVAQALVHMHRRGVFHADLKPNNIMVSRTGTVKVIDFGLARIRGEKSERVQGTPEYMAPETVTHAMVNERTDIYNFGAMMYRMVTFRTLPSAVASKQGDLPVTAKMWERIVTPAQDLHPGAPAELCELIHRCISYKAPGRPERMNDVQQELGELAERLVTSPDDRLEALGW